MTPVRATPPCFDSAEALQEAITALPLASSTAAGSETPELLLCAFAVVEVRKPLEIRDRSLRLGCSSSSRTSNEEPLCTLKASPGEETRLMEITASSSGSNKSSKVTVHLNHLRLENGEAYGEDGTAGAGGAILSKGANLVVEDCRFLNNVASQQGGALSVQDNGRPILLLVARTIFQENLSIQQEDCHSIYFHQDHPASVAELNTETDFDLQKEDARQRSLLEHWDDPAKAAQALQAYVPARGASLCF